MSKEHHPHPALPSKGRGKSERCALRTTEHVHSSYAVARECRAGERVRDNEQHAPAIARGAFDQNVFELRPERDRGVTDYSRRLTARMTSVILTRFGGHGKVDC